MVKPSDDFDSINHFSQDLNQAWKKILKLSDRVRQREKFDKTQSLLNAFFMLMIVGLIVSQVIIYDKFF